MRQGNRLTVRQQSFLRCVRDDSLLLDEAMERQEVKRWLMAKWLRRPVFWEVLGEMQRESRRRFRVEARMMPGYCMATLKLIAEGRLKATPGRVEALQALVKISVEIEKPRPRRRRKKVVKPPERLCHPNAQDQEEELLKILNGG
jgi:hypothetical protein